MVYLGPQKNCEPKIKWIYIVITITNENRLETKVNIVQFQKTWYPRAQLTELYQLRVEPLETLKKGVPKGRAV